MNRLEGKIALVTGGARGIGRAIYETYVAHCAKVAAADRLAHEAEATAAALGDNAMAVTMDVTDLGQKKREVGAAVQLGRMGDATDIAGPALFLASDQAAYVTAPTLNVDGGNWMS